MLSRDTPDIHACDVAAVSQVGNGAPLTRWFGTPLSDTPPRWEPVPRRSAGTDSLSHKLGENKTAHPTTIIITNSGGREAPSLRRTPCQSLKPHIKSTHKRNNDNVRQYDQHIL